MTIQTTEFQDDITIEECPNEHQIPFTMVSNDLIRANLSPNCIWLIIYLLSNKPGWKINIRQIINHVKGFIGKEKLYKILNEALESGYMHRQEYKVNNLRRCKYFVSWTPKFKKSLRHPEFQDTEDQHTENQYDKEQLLGEKTIPKKNIITSSSRASSSSPPRIADDDLKKPLSEHTKEIQVTRTNGQKISMSQSDVYAHFIKKPQYTTEMVRRAIEKITIVSGPVNDILKYLESICEGELRQTKASMGESNKIKYEYKEPEPEKPRVKMGDLIRRELEKNKDKK